MKNKKFLKLFVTATLFLTTVSWAQVKKPVTVTQQELDGMSQSQKDLKVKTHTDGSRSVDLKGRFQMHSVAKLVDGEVVYSCVGHDTHESDKPQQHITKSAIERGVQ